MRIAILTSGILPVPAVQGGAVENLIDFYLYYNNQHHLHDITIYSIWHKDIKKHDSLKSTVNHYRYIKVNSVWARIKKRIYYFTHGDEYYHYSIEYYLEQSMHHLVRQNYDIILLENRPGYALKLTNKTKAKLVYHLHNEKLSRQTLHNRRLYDAASCILTVSDFISNQIKTLFPKDTKCITIHNGINREAFSKGASFNIHRSTYNLNNDDFVLVYSGRINSDKGVMELIEAINIINHNKKIKLLIIGSSFFGNTNTEDTYFQSLKEKAQRLENQIVFTGFIPYLQMPGYLKLADVAVIPSIWDDPFPTTVLEAQAMGLPIITTRRGGIPEEVTEENAILLDTDKNFVKSLANAILDLYNHPEKRKEMSKASLERSKLFDKEIYAKKFFEALDGINVE